MPNYYAHFKFGAMVLERLPAKMRQELEEERTAFDLGCLGPDPLFFYRPWAMKNPARAEALRMHKEPARTVFLRLHRAAETGGPMARGYAAGFLCHYAMDAACHGYVLEEAAKGEYSHMRLEAGLDRLLMDRDGYKTPRLAGFPPVARDMRVYEAGREAYEQAGAKALRAGYRAMSLGARMLARLCGTGSEAVSERLAAMMEAAVEGAAERMEAFLRGEPPDGWYERDFYGK
ncbi:MAG: hypothetical protein EOM52_04945 [Clostridia bacterium]|nr:hypothetical protein [Clostridia bacterium]